MTKGTNVFEGIKLSAYGNQFIDGVEVDKAVLTLTAADSNSDSILVLNATAVDLSAGGTFNAVQINMTDASAHGTAGYFQGFYVNMTLSSTDIGGNTANQFNAFAADISLDCVGSSFLVGGGYIYIGKTASFSATGASVYGLCLDIQEIGTVNYKCNLWLQNSSTTAATVDTYILFSNGGNSGGVNTNMFYCQGITYPNYFLNLDATAAKGMLSTDVCDGVTATSSLKVLLGDSGYKILLYPAT